MEHYTQQVYKAQGKLGLMGQSVTHNVSKTLTVDQLVVDPIDKTLN